MIGRMGDVCVCMCGFGGGGCYVLFSVCLDHFEYTLLSKPVFPLSLTQLPSSCAHVVQTGVRTCHVQFGWLRSDAMKLTWDCSSRDLFTQ